jgi:hypothetical protein
LATPKSMILMTAFSPEYATRMFEGLRSRWITPFWCACWTASHTSMNSPMRSSIDRRLRSQCLVIGAPWTYSMTKYGSPRSVVPASKTRATLGWSMSANAWRSASKRATTCLESIPGLMIFSATRRRTGSDCSARYTTPMPPSPIFSRMRNAPMDSGSSQSREAKGSALSSSVGVSLGWDSDGSMGSSLRQPFAPL